MTALALRPARAALSFRRDLEFATEPELAKRMGCPRAYWLRAAVKELIDNSLDAAEEAGIETPSILVCTEGNEFSVADNGPGITPELVERLCDRAERTSTREAYAAPDRGSQGNALQTIMALPFGLGLDEARLTISSQGVEHTIRLRVNRLEQRIDLERSAREVPTEPGAIIGMWWPMPLDVDEIYHLVEQHAWLNSHASFRLNEDLVWERTADLTKWTPSLPTPAQWYTFERFAHRVLLELRRDPQITVAQFLVTFRGLTSTTKRAAVAAEAGLSYQPLAALLDASGTALDEFRTQALLSAMQEASRPPKPDVLGAVGKESFSAWARRNRDYGTPELLAYTTVNCVVQDEIPVRWEIGFCHLPEATERQLLVGQNFSPAISSGEMVSAILPHYSPYLGAWERIALFLHRITPARQTLDYGKSKLAVGYNEALTVRQALEKIAKPWIKRREVEQRGKKPPPPPAEPKAERITIKDAVWQELPAAYAQASSNGRYHARARQIYYAIRPRILELTGRAVLRDGYFTTNLLPLFMQDHPISCAGWRVHFDPRGTLHEPHTGHRVLLGTAAVESYVRGWTNGIDFAADDVAIGRRWSAETCGPHNRFGAVVIAEKEGIADLLLATGIGPRWDIAIVGGKGQATEAALKLADALKLPVFVLHDLDRSGFTIAANLRDGTWRHQYQNAFPVIDVGLRLNQAAGLEREPIDKNNLKSVGDDRLRECGATDDEIKFLRTHRVELNALTTEQLVDLVETALAEHGVAKVVPATEDLANAWRAAMAVKEIRRATAKANTQAKRRWQNAEAPPDLEERVRRLLEREPAMSWDEVVLTIAEEAVP